MKFCCKKLYLLDNFKLIVKNNFLYFKIKINKQKIYFKISCQVYIYFYANFVYFLTLLRYKKKISSICGLVYTCALNYLKIIRFFFYVNGYNCRLEIYKNFIFFFLGYTHPIVYKLPNFFNVGLIKEPSTDYEFFIEGFNKKKLMLLLVDFKMLRLVSDVYGGKGVFLLKEVFVARKTKKEIKK